MSVLAPPWAALAWGAPRALAADSVEAQSRQLFRQAEVHFSLREFDRALELYREAYRLKPLPGFLFNIAQCHRFSNRYEDAAFSYRVYLQRAPDAANRAEVEELVRQMEAEAQAQPPLTQDSPVTPPAAEPPSPVPAAPAPTPVVSVVSIDNEGPRLSPWVWGGGGLGVALLATGLVTGQMASSRSDRYNEPFTPIADRRALRDSGRTLAATSVITLSAGAIALAGAGALWFWERSKQAESTQSSASPKWVWAAGAAPLPHGVNFSLAGAF